jgi:hypothetical protein
VILLVGPHAHDMVASCDALGSIPRAPTQTARAQTELNHCAAKITGSRIFAIGQNLELFVSNIRCELARQGLTNQAILNALAVGNWASLVGILDRATWAAHRACECALLPVRVAVWGVEFVIACTCCCQDCMMLPCVHRMHCMGSAWRPQGHMLIVARQSRAHH